MRRPSLRIVIPLVLLAGLAVAWFMLRPPVHAAYEIQSRPLVQTVVATGRVVATSRAEVGSPVTGVVVERRVEEGDTVKPGDVLAVLRADDLEATVREAEAQLAQLRQATRPQAQAAVREAEARLAQASRETARRRQLANEQLIARETLEQAIEAETVARTALERARLDARNLSAGAASEDAAVARLAAARAQLEKAVVRAEVAGVVLTRNAEPGDLVQPGTVLFEIAREGDTEVLVPVDEKNLGVLEVGQAATCIADAWPSEPFPATVALIAPAIDPQRGTVDVRLAVEPVPAFLRQDMTVSVNIETGRRDDAVVVPNDALSTTEGERAEAWVVTDGRVERRTLVLGLRGTTLTEVTDGLQPGDVVLADAAAEVEPGDRVRTELAPLPATEAEAADAADTANELPVQLD